MPRIAWSAAISSACGPVAGGPHEGGLEPLHPLGRGARDRAVVVEHDLVGRLVEGEPARARPRGPGSRRGPRPAGGPPGAAGTWTAGGVPAAGRPWRRRGRAPGRAAPRPPRRGPRPASRSPLRSSRASLAASRRSVLTRSPGLGRDERRRDDDALDAQRGELAVERVAGRAGLVGDAQPGVRRRRAGRAACGSPPGRWRSGHGPPGRRTAPATATAIDALCTSSPTNLVPFSIGPASRMWLCADLSSGPRNPRCCASAGPSMLTRSRRPAAAADPSGP